MTIQIKKSSTADTRTCDYTKVSMETLLQSSHQHISDVEAGLMFWVEMLHKAAATHDWDKIDKIGEFYHDFSTNFKVQDWWINHRRISRHHLNYLNGVPLDVNLLDVLEYITDCVMAGMARSGEVSELYLDPAVLQQAFYNTVELLKLQVKVAIPEPISILEPGSKVRLAEQGSTIYTITGSEEHHGLTFYRVEEILGALFLRESLVPQSLFV